MARAIDNLIELLGSDLVALAQCYALDATVFPHSSISGDATRSVFIARRERHGPVVGFAATQRQGTRIEITGLAVARARRGEGFGGALLSHIAQEGRERGVRVIVLHVAVDNAPALALYRREGFHVTEVLKDHYRTGDAYEMVKKLAR